VTPRMFAQLAAMLTLSAPRYMGGPIADANRPRKVRPPHVPHQGDRELARRQRQIARGQISPTQILTT